MEQDHASHGGPDLPTSFQGTALGRPRQGAAQDHPSRGARKPLHGKGEQRSGKAGFRSQFRRRFREVEAPSALYSHPHARRYC